VTRGKFSVRKKRSLNESDKQQLKKDGYQTQIKRRRKMIVVGRRNSDKESLMKT